MAMIDYGTLVKKNGKIINEGIMFMKRSDMNIIPVRDAYEDISNKNTDHGIRNGYFAYVGDKDLMICFYKHIITFVSGKNYLGMISMGQPWYEKCDTKFSRYGLFNEKLYNPFGCGIDVRFESLDSDVYNSEQEWDYYTKYFSKEEVKIPSYWKIIKDAYGFEDTNSTTTYKVYKKMCKNLRRQRNFGGSVFGRHYNGKTRSDRFYVTFEYKGNTYEVVTGHGIDWNRSFYTKENMNAYGYTEKEQEFMRRFFG